MGAEPPVRFAGEELARYLPRLAPGRPLEVRLGTAEAMATAGWLLESALPDGAVVVMGDGRDYLVSGGSPAAVLHASYALLEALGARWLKPGQDGEVILPLDGPPPPLSIRSEPVFGWRGLADGCLSWWPGAAPFQAWLRELLEMVDWMGKMRMNRLFLHFNRLPPGDLSPVLPELERRGIALELGGHSLPLLLPPGARESDPGLCRMVDGLRRPDGNFCTSNPRTLDLLRRGASEQVQRLPPADLYHLWSYDARDDPWCRCPSCRDVSPHQQMWRAVSAAAEGIARARPGARIGGLLYHESLGAAESAPEGLRLLFAPRERCYSHAIDAGCPRNRSQMEELRRAMAYRGSDLSLLEYYGDPILMGMPANRPGMVVADLAAYQKEGVTAVYSLVFGALSWWLFPLQLYAYARGSWDPSLLGDAVREYCYALVGDTAGERLARYYRLEGEAAGFHLRNCRCEDGSGLPFPTLDQPWQVRERLAELEAGLRLLREAGRLLEGSSGVEQAVAPMMAIIHAHRLEEALHRAILTAVADGAQGESRAWQGPFIEAVKFMETAPSELMGVFGEHWMLPWLRRCAELGTAAQP